LRAEAERILRFAGVTREEVGRQFALPPAIVAAIVPDDQGTAKAEAPDVEMPGSLDVSKPDWSYQDTAVARCLAAFENAQPRGSDSFFPPAPAKPEPGYASYLVI